MENNTKKLSLSEQLVEARQRELKNPVVGSLRSHGKLWGMDVFSWYKPNLYELENTLSSFPAPIFWYANESDVIGLLQEDSDWISNLKFVLTYDKAEFTLPSKFLNKIESIVGTTNIEDALNLIRSIKKPQGILLFTSSNEDWAEVKNKIESFLKIHQNQLI